MSHPSTIAKFIVPDWGDIVDSAQGCRAGPQTNVTWLALYMPELTLFPQLQGQ